MLSRQERQAKLLREAEEARLAMLEESSRREAEQRAQRTEEERQRAQANREEAAAPPPPPAAVAPVEPEIFEPVAEETVIEQEAPAEESKDCPICGASSSADATTCDSCGFSF